MDWMVHDLLSLGEVGTYEITLLTAAIPRKSPHGGWMLNYNGWCKDKRYREFQGMIKQR